MPIQANACLPLMKEEFYCSVKLPWQNVNNTQVPRYCVQSPKSLFDKKIHKSDKKRGCATIQAFTVL